MEEKKVQRIILKENDILLVKVPRLFFRREYVTKLYEKIRKKLLPRKNKVLMLPEEIDISVIGEKEIREHISKIDLWDLWDEDGEEIDDRNI